MTRAASHPYTKKQAVVGLVLLALVGAAVVAAAWALLRVLPPGGAGALAGLIGGWSLH